MSAQTLGRLSNWDAPVLLEDLCVVAHIDPHGDETLRMALIFEIPLSSTLRFQIIRMLRRI